VEANYRAQISLPAGIDETRLLVVDENGDRAAETAWRPTDNYQPGPAQWDWRLHALGYERTSPWRPDELGFACNVEPIIRAPGMVPGS
jgi:hypothetical protein